MSGEKKLHTVSRGLQLFIFDGFTICGSFQPRFFGIFPMCQGRLAYFPLGPEPQLLWHGQKHMRNASERPCGGVAVLCFLVYSNFQLMVTCWFGLVVWDSTGTPK